MSNANISDITINGGGPTGLYAAAPWLFAVLLLVGWALTVVLAAPPPYMLPAPTTVLVLAEAALSFLGLGVVTPTRAGAT